MYRQFESTESLGRVSENHGRIAAARAPDTERELARPMMTRCGPLPRAEVLLALTFVLAGCGQATSDKAAANPGTVVSSDAKVVLTSIQVSPPSTALPANTTQQLAATGMYSNGKTKKLTTTASWLSSNPAVATVSSAGLVVALAPGITNVTAQSGGISDTVRITVTTATILSVAVTPAKRKLPVGATHKYTAIATFSDNSMWTLAPPVVVWSVQGSGATVNSTGVVTAVAASTAIIVAQAVSSNGAVLASGSANLTVTNAKLKSVAVTPSNPSVPEGLTAQFAATGTYSDSSTADITAQVSWTSSNNQVATISSAADSAGLASSVAPGIAVVTATDPKTGKNASTNLTVTGAILQSIAITPPAPTGRIGTNVQLIATGIYSDKTTQDVTTLVTWSSSLPAVAAVSNADGSQGLVTPVSVGSTSISAMDPTTGLTSSAVSFAVTGAALVSLTINVPSPTLPLGSTEQLTATGTYSDGTTADVTQTVEWQPSNGFASISNAPGSQGLVTALALGTTAFRAIDPNTFTIAPTVTVRVTAAALVSVAIAVPMSTLPLGLSEELTATGTYTDGTTADVTQTVTWMSSSQVVTVSNASGSQGLVTTASVGTTRITAIDSTTGVTSAAVTLNVAPSVLEAIALNAPSLTLPLGTSEQLGANATYSDGTVVDVTQTVTWFSNSPTLSVSNASGSRGMATSMSIGTANITAVDPTTGVSSAPTTLRATPAVLQSVLINLPHSVVAVGSSEQLAAIGTYSDGSMGDVTGTVTWSSSTPAATVSNAAGTQGLLTGAAAGSGSVTATDSTTGTTDTVPVIVIAFDISPTTATLFVGQSQQFTVVPNSSATWSAPLGGTVTASGLFTSPDTPGTYSVVATSVASPLISSTATVAVNAYPNCDPVLPALPVSPTAADTYWTVPAVSPDGTVWVAWEEKLPGAPTAQIWVTRWLPSVGQWDQPLPAIGGADGLGFDFVVSENNRPIVTFAVPPTSDPSAVQGQIQQIVVTIWDGTMWNPQLFSSDPTDFFATAPSLVTASGQQTLLSYYGNFCAGVPGSCPGFPPVYSLAPGTSAWTLQSETFPLPSGTFAGTPYAMHFILNPLVIRQGSAGVWALSYDSAVTFTDDTEFLFEGLGSWAQQGGPVLFNAAGAAPMDFLPDLTDGPLVVIQGMSGFTLSGSTWVPAFTVGASTLSYATQQRSRFLAQTRQGTALIAYANGTQLLLSELVSGSLKQVCDTPAINEPSLPGAGSVAVAQDGKWTTVVAWAAPTGVFARVIHR